MSTTEMVEYCREMGVDATINSVKDAVKRLRGAEEVVRVEKGYFPGPRLRGYVPGDKGPVTPSHKKNGKAS